MIVDGRLATVVIPRDAIEGAQEPDKAVAQALIDYVNDVQRAGIYPRHEMPAVAMQAYHASYYLAQVSNGGHGQFIRNTGIAMLPTISGDALAALQAMGAGAQHQILIEMLTWVKANLGEAAKQDGFSVRAQVLKALDDRFHAARQLLARRRHHLPVVRSDRPLGQAIDLPEDGIERVLQRAVDGIALRRAKLFDVGAHAFARFDR